MEILESELRRLLFGDDEDEAWSTLRRYFRPEPRFTAPLVYDWVPMPDLTVVLGDGEGGGLFEAASRQVIDLANAADDALRQRRFSRRREARPGWPVVVCEGDSWISHPFVDEIGDHLVEDGSNAFHVLNRGSAGDRLATMVQERQHETMLDEVDAAAMVLSGGGNDLLVEFDEFLVAPTDAEPSGLRIEALDRRLHEVMELMLRILDGVRTKDARLPILVHGYDYMKVAAPGRGRFLGPFFDAAGIEDPQQRQATMRAIVDRFNERLISTVATVPGVDYVDVRGTVPDDQWHDEIHPDSVGFEGPAGVLGARLRERIAEG